MCEPETIDWLALRVGGMPAYERVLRQLYAAQLELADQHARLLADLRALDARLARLEEPVAVTHS